MNEPVGMNEQVKAGRQERIAGAASSLRLSISDAQIAQLIGYQDQLLRWNKVYNLTALRDPDKVLIQHVFDSLSVINPLSDKFAPGRTISVLDVGSGGGLPGAVLAIMKPDWQVCCIDAVEKKTAFIRQAAGVLKLPNLVSEHIRIERKPPAQADLVISRAFASLVDFSDWSGMHVGSDGHLVAMKGRLASDEVSQLEEKGAWTVGQVQKLNVPELDAERCLVWLQQVGKYDK
ncbi:ribosomal RNA small subunit methyltransferase G [Advenella mimigardefordensis DPN7]|uniref:Ribosomal RNA small subunit methyltransferase G n=1 Tax=Advenella mimigardefordensis (strain DSM 17166 / LMG 22922 / DPN7) TaxID=1247726 RepID=W0PGC4_ADVMD|nr:ribosomal RNA small subunit methyltransferase G [Advenella mimigardefordensis DPN7]